MREHACVWGMLVSAMLATGCMVGDTDQTDQTGDPDALVMNGTPSIEARGGKTRCTGTPTLTVTPNPVPVGSTSITISGTGFCADWGVFVDIVGAAHCYDGQYTYNGAFTDNFAYTFDTPGTYTVGAWQALTDPNGGYMLGVQRTSVTITVQ